MVSYTYKSLAFVWITVLGLFGLAASGAVTGRWFLVLVVVALTAPALILRRPPRVTANAVQA